MTTPAERAQQFGGDRAYPEDETLVRVPADQTLEFCVAEIRGGHEVEFVECLLLFDDGGIQPSLDLSALRRDFEDAESFLTFVAEAAGIAGERAKAINAVPLFEIGIDER